MIDTNIINDRVRVLVREILGLPNNSVRPANQNATVPNIPDEFATVFITPTGSEGWDIQKFEDLPAPSLEVKETITGIRRINASVQFFRGGAYTKAVRLGMLLQSSGAVSKMQAVGLGLVKVSPARDLTATVDTIYESRGQIDIEFYLVADEEIITPTYGQFTVSVTTPISTTSTEVFEP